MIFKRVTTENDPMLLTAIELYKISFPLHEQRDEYSQRQVLSMWVKRWMNKKLIF